MVLRGRHDMPGRGLSAWPVSTPHLACFIGRRGNPSPVQRPARYVRGGAGVEGWWGAGLLTSGLNHVVQASSGGAGGTQPLLRRRDMGGQRRRQKAGWGRCAPTNLQWPCKGFPCCFGMQIHFFTWWRGEGGVRLWGVQLVRQPAGNTLSSAVLTKIVGSFLFPARAWLPAAATTSARISYLFVMAWRALHGYQGRLHANPGKQNG